MPGSSAQSVFGLLVLVVVELVVGGERRLARLVLVRCAGEPVLVARSLDRVLAAAAAAARLDLELALRDLPVDRDQVRDPARAAHGRRRPTCVAACRISILARGPPLIATHSVGTLGERIRSRARPRRPPAARARAARAVAARAAVGRDLARGVALPVDARAARTKTMPHTRRMRTNLKKRTPFAERTKRLVSLGRPLSLLRIVMNSRSTKTVAVSTARKKVKNPSVGSRWSLWHANRTATSRRDTHTPHTHTHTAPTGSRAGSRARARPSRASARPRPRLRALEHPLVARGDREEGTAHEMPARVKSTRRASEHARSAISRSRPPRRGGRRRGDRCPARPARRRRRPRRRRPRSRAGADRGAEPRARVPSREPSAAPLRAAREQLTTAGAACSGAR